MIIKFIQTVTFYVLYTSKYQCFRVAKSLYNHAEYVGRLFLRNAANYHKTARCNKNTTIKSHIIFCSLIILLYAIFDILKLRYSDLLRPYAFTFLAYHNGPFQTIYIKKIINCIKWILLRSSGEGHIHRKTPNTHRTKE